MTILEEVIMYTFQQCVYYITKVTCHSCKGAVQLMSNTHTQKLRSPSFFPVYFCMCIKCVCVCVCRVQALYVVLPALLDCNPFPVDNSEPCWKGGVGFPEPVRRVLQVSLGVFVILNMIIDEY